MSKRTVIKTFTAVIFFAATLTISIPLKYDHHKFRPADESRFDLMDPHQRNTAVSRLSSRNLLVYNNNTLAFENQQKECRSFHDVDFTERCSYIKNLSACQTDGGFVNYIQFVYCASPNPNYVIPILLFLCCWLIFLFISLGVTAEDFFCPSLNVISHTLGLSQNIAGVTFLAFGNGAPDIFSLVAAISESHDGDAGLAFGALFGAGIFVTTMVTGSIAWVSTFQMAERPFLRDVIFYIAAVYWVYHIMWYESINLRTSIGLLGLYAFYVAVVVISRKINQMQRKKSVIHHSATATNGNPLADPTAYTEPPETEVYQRTETPTRDFRNGLTATQILVASSAIPRPTSSNMMDDNVQAQSTQNYDSDSESLRLLGGGKKAINKSMLHLLLEGMCPINIEDWKDLSLFNKIYEIIKSPIQFVLLVTVPVVDYDVDKHNWNKPLNTLHLILGPVFFIFATQLNSKEIYGNFHAWHLVLCISVLLAAVVWCTTNKNQRPKFHSAYAYLGFLVAVLWIYSIANELVNVLQMFGAVLKVSDGILGLTLLAWGNSIGDLISNTTMARQGFPRMAISACFGGPFFNMVVGIGISCTIKILRSGGSHSFYIKHTDLQDILALFLLISLVSSLFIMLLTKFKASRPYTAYLFVLYLVFLTFALLIETKVISWTYK